VSPYSGKTELPEPRTKTGHKFAWARLNADALFLALYAFISGIVALMDPHGDTTIREVGFPTPGFYLWASMLIAGGLGLLSALVRQHVLTEIVARTILTFACFYEVFRYTQIFGWDNPILFKPLVIAVLVLFITALRHSVLLSKKGLVVRLPERTNDGLSYPEDDTKEVRP
jgi:hypothetical protein